MNNSNKNLQPCPYFCHGQLLSNLAAQNDLSSLNSVFLDACHQIVQNADCQLVFDFCESKSKSKRYTQTILSNDKPIAQLLLNTLPDDEQIHALALLSQVFGYQYGHLGRVNTDRLTGLGNRQALESKLAQHFNRNRTYSRKVDAIESCLAIIDIDYFKKINDSFGHLYGDEVLLLLAQIMQQTFRSNDHLFRYGGEEFIIILDDVSAKLSCEILERFRLKIAEHAFPQVGNITLSIGYTLIDKKSDAATNIGRADSALYYAKNNGRNATHCYESLVEQGVLEETSRSTEGITLF